MALDKTKLNPIGGQSLRGRASAEWYYNNDGGDDVTAADYFNGAYTYLSVGDTIEVIGADKLSSVKYVVTASASTGVTIAELASASASQVNTAIVSATLAEINAGKVLVATVSGKQIKVVGLELQVVGTFLTGTSVEVEDDNATPVVVASYAQAGLADGANLLPNSANVTIGAGYLAALTLDKNLVVSITGSDFTGGTSITFKIQYQLV
jgi:hypothetical protein